MITLSDVKSFLRIDHSEEDVFLSSLMLATEKYIKNATTKDADENTELFHICHLMMVAHWYETRSLESKTQNIPFHLESMLMQIAYAEGVDFGDVTVVDSGRFNGGGA